MTVTATIIRIGETVPGARSCAASTSAGSCSCGWQAHGPDMAAETMEHLYGDLTGAARRFACQGSRIA
jgi:hypothetical protein